MTNTLQRKFRKGDVVRCKIANFSNEQKAITPVCPLLNHLYIVRAVLANSALNGPHAEVILLEEVHNKTYRTIYDRKEYIVEHGFNPVRFELAIAAEESDWAVSMTLLQLSC